jgi:hexokinase
MIATGQDLLPDGRETGDAFAVELGGGGLRLAHVVFGPGRHSINRLVEAGLDVPASVKAGHVDALFDWVAASLLPFVAAAGWDAAARGPPPLGLCFAFPMRQAAGDSGELLGWAKGFSCEGGVGADPAALLTAATARAGVRMPVLALANDAVAALAAARYARSPPAVAAVVLDAGANAAYVECLAAIGKYYAASQPARDWLPRSPDVVVDVEWPHFADAALPALPDDAAGVGAFEALVGPMYVAEAARRLLARCAAAGGWYGAGPLPPALASPGALDAATVYRIGYDGSESLDEAGSTLRLPLADRAAARDACAALLRRAARLTAAGLAGVLQHLECEPSHGPVPPVDAAPDPHATSFDPPPAHPRSVVALEGPLFRRVGGALAGDLRQGLDDCLGPAASSRVDLVAPPGGAPLGVAALAASAAARATAMGTQDVDGVEPDGGFFPPRAAGATPVPPAPPRASQF